MGWDTVENTILSLKCVLWPNSARSHNWLLIASPLWETGPANACQRDSEAVKEVRPSELIVEGSAADRYFQHDIQPACETTKLP
jgi:hypothetical protein